MSHECNVEAQVCLWAYLEISLSNCTVWDVIHGYAVVKGMSKHTR